MNRDIHHKIVRLFTGSKNPKGFTWFYDESITIDVIYWALRNVCALTNMSMNDFEIDNWNRHVYVRIK